jgi:hypothetical protein
MTKEKEAIIREFLGQKVGEASMCWDPIPGSSVFDSASASKIVDSLFSLFEENLEAAIDAAEQIVQDARNGESDSDFRSIIHRIRTLKSG